MSPTFSQDSSLLPSSTFQPLLHSPCIRVPINGEQFTHDLAEDTEIGSWTIPAGTTVFGLIDHTLAVYYVESNYVFQVCSTQEPTRQFLVVADGDPGSALTWREVTIPSDSEPQYAFQAAAGIQPASFAVPRPA